MKSGFKRFFLFLFHVLFLIKGYSQDKIVLQLRWDHQFQFAGYYAAQKLGYYDDLGINVEIRSAIDAQGNILSAVEEVMWGYADFGIGAADILLANDVGADLMITASIFQKSAVSFFILQTSPYRDLFDLYNLNVARRYNDLPDVEFQAMLISQGIDPMDIEVVDFRPGVEDLINGDIDVLPGYRISTPYILNSYNVPYQMISPSDYGIDFYGDSLFTKRDLAIKDPELVEAFTNASIRGWTYALRNPEEMIQYITETYNTKQDVASFILFNEFQSQNIGSQTMDEWIDLGHINPFRWERMHSYLRELGIISHTFEPDMLFFSIPEIELQKDNRSKRIYIILLISLTTLLLTALFFVFLLNSIVNIKTRQIRKKNEELTRELSLISKLEKEKKQLQEKQNHDQRLKSMGVLSGGIAHDFNNVLNIIVNAFDLLKSSCDSFTDMEEDYISIIEEACNRASGLSAKLLTFGRKSSQDIKNIDLENMLINTVEMIKGTMDKKMQIVFHISDSNHWTNGNYATLQNCIINIAINASHAMPRGGIFSVELSKKEINQEFCDKSPFNITPGIYSEIILKDNGVGIPKKNLSKIFDPFFTTKEIGKGTGLGLSSVYGALETHKGSINVESEEGQGTAFFILLPQSKE